MELSFNDEHMWYWWINLVAYVAVLITYLTVNGHEMVFALYLPLDMLLNACKAGYFFVQYFRDRREKALEAEFRQGLEAHIKKKLATRIRGMFNVNASQVGPADN